MIKLSKYGIKEWLGSAIIAAIFIIAFTVIGHRDWWGFYIGAVATLLIWIAIAAFFRDPNRKVPTNSENSILSPADGVVADIETVSDYPYRDFFNNKKAVRVGIFLSIFDVHINRSPCNLEVMDIIYKEGKFFDARDGRASRENESNTLLCIGKIGDYRFPMAIKQISGAIARRIVCRCKRGNFLKSGEKFGMIKFGSRTELYLPNEEVLSLCVKIGDRVKAGVDIIAEVKK